MVIFLQVLPDFAILSFPKNTSHHCFVHVRLVGFPWPPSDISHHDIPWIFSCVTYLVGGLEHFYFPRNMMGISSSQLTNSYFSEGWPSNHQAVLLHKILTKRPLLKIQKPSILFFNGNTVGLTPCSFRKHKPQSHKGHKNQSSVHHWHVFSPCVYPRFHQDFRKSKLDKPDFPICIQSSHAYKLWLDIPLSNLSPWINPSARLSPHKNPHLPSFSIMFPSKKDSKTQKKDEQKSGLVVSFPQFGSWLQPIPSSFNPSGHHRTLRECPALFVPVRGTGLSSLAAAGWRAHPGGSRVGGAHPVAGRKTWGTLGKMGGMEVEFRGFQKCKSFQKKRHGFRKNGGF